MFGLIVIWQLLDLGSKRPRDFLKAPALQWSITMVMGVWLLRQCDSKTSIICLIIGGALLISTKIRFFENKRPAIVWICLVAVPMFFLLDNVLHISEPLLTFLGRNATLSNRTEIWEAVKSRTVDPLFGCGYLNFWDIVGTLELEQGDVDLKTAHNGYLEIFLDGGYVGIFFLVIMLANVGINQAKSFIRHSPAGAIGLAFFCMTLLNNVSESLFARRSPLWSAFLMVAVGYLLLARGAETAEEAAIAQDSYGPLVEKKIAERVSF